MFFFHKRNRTQAARCNEWLGAPSLTNTAPSLPRVGKKKKKVNGRQRERKKEEPLCKLRRIVYLIYSVYVCRENKVSVLHACSSFRYPVISGTKGVFTPAASGTFLNPPRLVHDAGSTHNITSCDIYWTRNSGACERNVFTLCVIYICLTNSKFS